MANIITAGNSTNGGTQIVTDTSGTLNIVTGSGSGVTAMSIDASGNVSGVLKSGTSVSASGTSIDFTSIPSTAKRITVMFSGISTNGTSGYIIQIGTSGGLESTGYLGSTAIPIPLTTTAGATATTGFSIVSAPAAATIAHGSVTLYYVGSNLWVSSSALGISNAAGAIVGGGSKTLSGTLDRIRITTVNGTDTFDAGSINILYE